MASEPMTDERLAEIRADHTLSVLLSTGDARDAVVGELIEEVRRLRALVPAPGGGRPELCVCGHSLALHALSTLVYWHDQGHIDESWWDEARSLAAAVQAAPEPGGEKDGG